MAAGDRAAAAGLAIVPGSRAANQLEDAVNETRDMVADVQTTRARSKVSASAPSSPQVGDLWFQPI